MGAGEGRWQGYLIEIWIVRCASRGYSLAWPRAGWDDAVRVWRDWPVGHRVF